MLRYDAAVLQKVGCTAFLKEDTSTIQKINLLPLMNQVWGLFSYKIDVSDDLDEHSGAKKWFIQPGLQKTVLYMLFKEKYHHGISNIT